MPRACNEDLFGKASNNGGRRSVLARCISTDPETKGAKASKAGQIECLAGLPRFRGVFGADPGEGDRIVVMNRDQEILLDVKYWWAKEPDIRH